MLARADVAPDHSVAGGMVVASVEHGSMNDADRVQEYQTAIIVLVISFFLFGPMLFTLFCG